MFVFFCLRLSPRVPSLAVLVATCSFLLLVVGCKTASRQTTEPEPALNPAPSVADPLSRLVELGSNSDDVRGLLRIIATGAFGGRLQVDPEISGSFNGLTGRVTVYQALDTLCQAAGCTWRTEGDPPTLIVEPAEI